MPWSRVLFHVDLMNGPIGTESQASRPRPPAPPHDRLLPQTRRSRSACAGPLAVAQAGAWSAAGRRRLKDGRLELVEVPDPAPGPGDGVGSARGLGAQRGHRAGHARDRAQGADRQGAGAARSGAPGAGAGADRGSALDPGAGAQTGSRSWGRSATAPPGTVLEAGPEARGLAPGDRVAIAGGGFASHAEVDVVPSLLCARVPDGCRAEEAAFATLGRDRDQRLSPRRGPGRVDRGRDRAGPDRPARGAGRSRGGMQGPGRGPRARAGRAREARRAPRRCCAPSSSRARAGRDRPTPFWSAPPPNPTTRSCWPRSWRATAPAWSSSATWRWTCRAAPFYEKELDLRLARSYGPGRYDPNYELHGLDYPIGYVRWTEQRNMEAFLEPGGRAEGVGPPS